MKKATLSLLLLAIVIFACKKESTTSTKTPVEYLKAHKWAGVSVTINPANDWFKNGKKITDIYAASEECGKDDIIGFSSDTTFYSLGGALKCDSYEKDTLEKDKYFISSDLKYITRDYFFVPSLIKEISDTKVVFETTFINPDDKIQYVLTETYKAK